MRSKVNRVRWDHADLALYFSTTGELSQPVLHELCRQECSNDGKPECIKNIYRGIIDGLIHSQTISVPCHKEKFFQVWWDDELEEAKQRCIASCRLWRSMGRPGVGAIYDAYRKDKAAYKLAVRAKERDDKQVYTNDLHEALLRKQGTAFWKCWGSKFDACSQMLGKSRKWNYRPE